METVVKDTLDGWAGQWDALVDLLPLPSPFLKSWWLEHTAVGEPVFVLAVRSGELLGGAAFQRTTRAGCEWIELLGDGPLAPDHLDLVTQPCEVARVKGVVRGWLGRKGSRVIDFVGLVEESWLASATPGFGSETVHSVAPYLVLPATYDGFLADRPGKLRSTITRTRKRLVKAGTTTRVRSAAEVDDALDALLRLHGDRWGAQSAFTAGWESFSDAARAGASHDGVEFTELVDADGRVVATELEFRVGRRASFYQAGRLDEHDFRGSGSALKGAIIERLIGQGVCEFDLLRGDESYKAEWATARRSLMRVRKGVGARGIALAAGAELNRSFQLARARRAE